MNSKNRNPKFSQEYYDTIQLYKKFHTEGTKKLSPEQTFAGHSLIPWGSKIKQIIDITQSNSITDFGCGKALGHTHRFKINQTIYQNLADYWNIEFVQLYDPGVKEFSSYPTEKTDGFICTDVIEHIPSNDIEIFIDQLYSLSKKFVFVVIATIPASKFFEDGRNIHLTIKKEHEWKQIFKTFDVKYPEIRTFLEFNN